MKDFRRMLLLPLILALALTGTGFRECGGGGKNSNEQPLTPEQKVEKQKRDAEAVVSGLALGIDTAAQGLGPGIETVRSFRLAGKGDPKRNLSLARKAQKFSQTMHKVTNFLLAHAEFSASDGRSIADDIDELLSLAQEIGSVTVTTDQGKQLVFSLGVLAAKTGVQIAARNFADKLPAGFSIPITEEAKQHLQSASRYLDEADRLLDRSIKELEAAGASTREAKRAQGRAAAPRAAAARHSVVMPL